MQPSEDFILLTFWVRTTNENNRFFILTISIFTVNFKKPFLY